MVGEISMKLFAYGTLMTADGLRLALGPRADAMTYRVARLPGWRRVWNAYREEWSGGVLNLEPSAEGSVVGVLIDGLSEDDLALLDHQESTHLPREQVCVQPEWGEAETAQLYWRRKGNHQGRPSPRYLAIVLERARQAGNSVFESVSSGSVDAAGLPKHFV
jgi:Gamma-glutamyl cyclotransferase, AIG2-like